MFMGRNRDISLSKGWQDCPLFYKSLILICLPLSLIGIFTTLFLDSLAMVPSQVFSFQLWRLFTSWAVDISLLNSLFGILMLYYYYVPREQTLGTAYSILDFFTITSIIQLTICLAQFFISLVIENVNMFGFGLWSMVFVYMSRACYENPDAQRPFCCLPCTIHSKYFPVAMLMIFSLIGGLRAGDTIGFFIGLIQFLFRNKVLIRYPITWITKLEQCLPNVFTRRSDFITTAKCGSTLQAVCSGTNFNPQLRDTNQNQGGVIMGSGLVIGTTQNNNLVRNQNDLRDFWANKESESPQELRQQMNDTMMSDESSRNFR